jgi:hypothetical protein
MGESGAAIRRIQARRGLKKGAVRPFRGFLEVPCSTKEPLFILSNRKKRALFYKGESGMAHTFQELKGKTVAELREIAAGVEHEAVKGYTQLNKEHLLVALCKALNIDTHEHKEAEGIDKTAYKKQIRELKAKKAEVVAAKDAKKAVIITRKIHRLKRAIRKAEGK